MLRVWALVLILLLPAMAGASPIFDSLPRTGTGWEFNGGYREAVAFPFTAPAPGYRLTRIDLAVGIWGNGANEIEVDLLADNGGLPGAEVETWQVSKKLNGSSLSIHSALKPLLAGGAQYWIAVDLQQLPDSDVVWWWSASDRGLWAYRGSWHNNDPNTWVHGNQFGLGDARGAFAVYGHAVVPEPASLLLIGAGLIAFGAIARRHLLCPRSPSRQ